MLDKLILYNTINKKREIFEPIDHKLVKLYVCGPTIYDHPHLGNARSIVIYDILFRILIYLFGYRCIKYVRNITDIDDKIIARAAELKIHINELTTNVLKDFHETVKYLHCLKPTIEPKATEHIDDMQAIIQLLLDNGSAYLANGEVYFNVEKYEDYNQLSNRKFEEMLEGVRIEHQKNKKNNKDFVLWKKAEDINDYPNNFASPWGLGRPGWHIECSAMSYKHLGENFDLHGGGADLIFPHHTNEIAQSKCAFPGSGFANYWVHNGFLTVNGEKMSKSLGNFITVNDLKAQKIAGEVVRLLLLSANYRHPLDYGTKALQDSHKILDYWYRALESCTISETNDLDQEFIHGLLDDMNTPLAIKIINDYAKKIHSLKTANQNNIEQSNSELMNSLATKMLNCAKFIGLLVTEPVKWFGKVNDQEIEELIALRNEAKKNKDYAQADLIRSQLLSKGIMIEDRADGGYFIREIDNT